MAQPLLTANGMLHSRRLLLASLFAVSLAVVACGDGDQNVNGNDNENGNDPGPDAGLTPVPTYTVSGTVVDFITGDPIAGDATVSVVGISPPPSVSVTGSSFTISEVPGASIFDLKVGGAGYEYTFSASVEVGNGNIEGLIAKAVKTDYVTAMAAEFVITPNPTYGIVIAQLKDNVGGYLADINANEFYLNNATPQYLYFLDDNRQPNSAYTKTYAYGYAVFFQVAAGYATITASPNSTYLMTMTPARVEADVVTLAAVYGEANGQVVKPQNVSFANDVYPLFAQNFCTSCHGGGGNGQDAGLFLDAGANKTLTELQELSDAYGVARIDTLDPAASLILQKPLVGGDYGHPYKTWDQYDPRYLTILAWIEEGALDN